MKLLDWNELRAALPPKDTLMNALEWDLLHVNEFNRAGGTVLIAVSNVGDV